MSVMSVSGVNKNNESRFLEEIEYCYQNVPLFRTKLEEHKIGIEQIEKVEDIAMLPVFDKSDFRKNFPIGVMAKGHKLNDARLTRSPSSGTTGDRLLTYEYGALLLDRAIQCSMVNEAILDAFVELPRRHIRYSAPNCSDVECANPNSSFDDRILDDGTLVLPVFHDLLTTSDALLNTAVEEAVSFNPNLYYVDATHFAFLIRYSKEVGATLKKAPTIATFSSLTLNARRQIEEVVGKQMMFQLVSMSEVGWIAMECKHGSLHLNPDSFVFEFLNFDGESAEQGELAELVITSLDCGAVPHVRYKTGDVYRLRNHKCECGGSSPTVFFEGRRSDLIRLSDCEQVTPREVDEAIGSLEWLDLYQLTQKTINEFELKVIVNKHYQEEYCESIIDSLGALLKSADIQFTTTSYIETERSGKFRICKPL